MADEQKKILPIDYTSRDFESIRSDLLEIAERLYPQTPSRILVRHLLAP